MDNFTHSLTGWALGQTGLKRKSRKGLAALILGANMPDIDVFFFWVPWAPLATHRGVTHSLIGGVLFLPPVLAGLLWLFDRWQVKRGATFKSGLEMHFGWLVALAYIGTLSHPLLDWQNSYAVQFFSPLSNKWFHNDTLFIIDVWIWTGMAFAIWLSRRWEKLGKVNWGRPATAALGVLVGYITLNAGITGFAKEAPRIGPPYAMPRPIFASPPPVEFWKRNLIWHQDGRISFGWYNPLHSLFYLQSHTKPVPDGMDDPLVPHAMVAGAAVSRFMRWSVLTMAEVKREHCKATVTFSDARFGGRTSGRFSPEVVVPIEGPGCPPAAPAAPE